VAPGAPAQLPFLGSCWGVLLEPVRSGQLELGEKGKGGLLILICLLLTDLQTCPVGFLWGLSLQQIPFSFSLVFPLREGLRLNSGSKRHQQCPYYQPYQNSKSGRNLSPCPNHPCFEIFPFSHMTKMGSGIEIAVRVGERLLLVGFKVVYRKESAK
jgi:hypothetical protein